MDPPPCRAPPSPNIRLSHEASSRIRHSLRVFFVERVSLALLPFAIRSSMINTFSSVLEPLQFNRINRYLPRLSISPLAAAPDQRISWRQGDPPMIILGF